MGVVGTVLTTVPLLAVFVNFYQTARHNVEALDAHLTLRFTYVALVFCLSPACNKLSACFPT